MIPMSLRAIATATGGELTDPTAAELVVDGPVVTDSREAGPGGLYIARRGEHADGHDFVASAAAAGAVAALTERPVDGLPGVVVPDAEVAFGQLARAVVDASPNLQVIGITGSSGKTSTKDLLGTVLAAAGPTVAPIGSYNSEIGVPLTVCRVSPQTRFLVVEMGARGIGHVAYLAQVAPPSVGVVLNVGTAHVGEFGSREAIAVAKSELVAALPTTGLAVLNADDAAVRAMAEVAPGRVVLVGESEDADVRATDVSLDDAGRPRFLVHTPAGSADVALRLVGRHHVGNALAVIAVAQEFGLEIDVIVGALDAATALSKGRMEVTETAGITVVNDAYNANPDSMHAALEALAAIGRRARTWAVLGTMLELGDESDALHAQVGRDAVAHGVDHLVVVGAAARPMADAARAQNGSTAVEEVADVDAAEAFLREHLRSGDVALFKSSRDAGLRLLADRLADTLEDNS